MKKDFSKHIVYNHYDWHTIVSFLGFIMYPFRFCLLMEIYSRRRKPKTNAL